MMKTIKNYEKYLPKLFTLDDKIVASPGMISSCSLFYAIIDQDPKQVFAFHWSGYSLNNIPDNLISPFQYQGKKLNTPILSKGEYCEDTTTGNTATWSHPAKLSIDITQIKEIILINQARRGIDPTTLDTIATTLSTIFVGCRIREYRIESDTGQPISVTFEPDGTYQLIPYGGLWVIDHSTQNREYIEQHIQTYEEDQTPEGCCLVS